MAISIEALSSLVLFVFCLLAFWSLLKNKGIDVARGWVIDGTLLTLSLMVGATLLKTLQATTWNQIGMLAALIALRLSLGQVFKKIRGPAGPPFGKLN